MVYGKMRSYTKKVGKLEALSIFWLHIVIFFGPAGTPNIEKLSEKG